MADEPDEFTHELDFMIEARPRITVLPMPGGEVQISVMSMNEDRQSVELEAIRIPHECLAPIAAALQRLADAK